MFHRDNDKIGLFLAVLVNWSNLNVQLWAINRFSRLTAGLSNWEYWTLSELHRIEGLYIKRNENEANAKNGNPFPFKLTENIVVLNKWGIKSKERSDGGITVEEILKSFTMD